MGDEKNPRKALGAPRMTVVVGAVVAIAAALMGRTWLLHAAPTPHPSPVVSPGVRVVQTVAQRTAQLIGPPRGYTPIFTTALATRAAINRGDFALADETIKKVRQESRVQGWHFAPFPTFVDDIVEVGNRTFLNHLNRWIAQDQTSAAPRLLRALYYFDTAWLIRGHAFTANILPNHLQVFSQYMEKATADVVQARHLDPSNPYTSYVWLTILSGAGNTEQVEEAFQRSIQHFPNYYPLYKVRLRTLEPKWGGSVAAMYGFVDAYADPATTHSPKKVLYLQMYADLLNAVSIYCYHQHNVSLACVAYMMDHVTTPVLDKNAYRTLKLYDHVNKAEFSLAIAPILARMIATAGGERDAGTFLQLASRSLKSDDALVANDTARNNFVIDKLAASVWDHQRQFDNAETLLKRAISDLPNTHFITEEQKDTALAGLYNGLARVYIQRHEYRRTAAYAQAAHALGGPGYGALACAAWFNLKQYPDAIRTCTEQIHDSGSMAALFWRARSFEASSQTDKALADYRRVASSESRFRTYSAIAISVIYGRQNKMADMLEALNHYQYLYNPNTDDLNDIAVAYNNLCYAKMHLGDLQGALKDCNASLRFGNLPDAYAKQQELVRRLKARHRTTAPALNVPPKRNVGPHLDTQA